MRALTLTVGLVLWGAALHAQAATNASSHALKWGPAPAVFPKGARMAVVSGDPGKAEEFTVDLSFPAGYKIPAHYHPTAETVTVKKGIFLVGMGDTLDVAKTKPMKAGASGSLPANMHHFALTKSATVVSVKSMGPFAMTYVNPADDPSKSETK